MLFAFEPVSAPLVRLRARLLRANDLGARRTPEPQRCRADERRDAACAEGLRLAYEARAPGAWAEANMPRPPSSPPLRRRSNPAASKTPTSCRAPVTRT